MQVRHTKMSIYGIRRRRFIAWLWSNGSGLLSGTGRRPASRLCRQGRGRRRDYASQTAAQAATAGWG